MRLQRAIASLVLSVLSLTPLAPALIAQAPVVAPHCVRAPLAPAAPVSGMHCHEAAGHAHPMASAEPPSDSTRHQDAQFQSNGCCTSHDCCNSTVRAQWAQPSDFVSITTGALVFVAEAVAFASAPLTPQFNATRGRAPPAF